MTVRHDREGHDFKKHTFLRALGEPRHAEGEGACQSGAWLRLGAGGTRASLTPRNMRRGPVLRSPLNYGERASDVRVSVTMS